jgi:FMN phosphatase YigB (HAD superfamily)
MITTILLDIGGTVFIKMPDGLGTINPAIIYLNQHVPETIQVVILSDTDMFDVPELLQKTFPELKYNDVYTKMMNPWIDKTKSETYTRICETINRKPSECVLIDNLPEFKSAAEAVGIKTYNIDQDSINRLLEDLK